jgi:hypothetical protein
MAPPVSVTPVASVAATLVASRAQRCPARRRRRALNAESNPSRTACGSLNCPVPEKTMAAGALRIAHSYAQALRASFAKRVAPVRAPACRDAGVAAAGEINDGILFARTRCGAFAESRCQAARLSLCSAQRNSAALESPSIARRVNRMAHSHKLTS